MAVSRRFSEALGKPFCSNPWALVRFFDPGHLSHLPMSHLPHKLVFCVLRPFRSKVRVLAFFPTCSMMLFLRWVPFPSIEAGPGPFLPRFLSECLSPEVPLWSLPPS